MLLQVVMVVMFTLIVELKTSVGVAALWTIWYMILASKDVLSEMIDLMRKE